MEGRLAALTCAIFVMSERLHPTNPQELFAAYSLRITACCCVHRWRTYLRPDVKHPHLEPFTEWEAAVIVQAQQEMGNNWLGAPYERFMSDLQLAHQATW